MDPDAYIAGQVYSRFDDLALDEMQYKYMHILENPRSICKFITRQHFIPFSNSSSLVLCLVRDFKELTF